MIATFMVIVFATAFMKSASGQPANTNPPSGSGFVSNAPPAEQSVDLAASQLNAIKIETVGTNLFSVEKTAVGSIDYDEDLSVQVFSPYQGKIITALANLGDNVQKGQPLYTIDSPDLIQAESTFDRGRRGFRPHEQRTNARHRPLRNQRSFGTGKGTSHLRCSKQPKALSKRHGTRSGYLANRNAEIDQIVATRKIDPHWWWAARWPGGSPPATRSQAFWCNRAARPHLIRWPISQPSGWWRTSPKATAQPFMWGSLSWQR